MRTYEIHKVTNGDLSAVPVISIDHTYFDTPDSIKASAKIGYDDEGILVHLETVEENIRIVEKGPLGAPCQDSCLEFFFCPMEGDTRYFNIEFNAAGCMFLGFGRSVNDHVRLVGSEGRELLSPVIRMTEDGWVVDYRIPYAFIQLFFPDFKVYGGKKIRANCYKCADCSEPPHYMAWSPIVGEPFRFHRPECYGQMIFVD
jgi:hypothetical protein